MGIGHMVSSFHDIWGQPDNEHISICGYGINISIFRHTKNMKLGEFGGSVSRLSCFLKLPSQSSFLALPPDTVPLISFH